MRSFFDRRSPPSVVGVALQEFTNFRGSAESLWEVLDAAPIGKKGLLINDGSGDYIGLYEKNGTGPLGLSTPGVRPLYTAEYPDTRLAKVTPSQIGILTAGGTGTGPFSYGATASSDTLPAMGICTILRPSTGLDVATGVLFTTAAGDITLGASHTVAIGDLIIVEGVSEFSLGGKAGVADFRWLTGNVDSECWFRGDNTGLQVKDMDGAGAGAYLFEPQVVLPQLNIAGVWAVLAAIAATGGTDYCCVGWYDETLDTSAGSGVRAEVVNYVRYDGVFTNGASGGTFTGTNPGALWQRFQSGATADGQIAGGSSGSTTNAAPTAIALPAGWTDMDAIAFMCADAAAGVGREAIFNAINIDFGWY